VVFVMQLARHCLKLGHDRFPIYYSLTLSQRQQLMALKSTIFWDITPCSPLKVNRRFGGTCRLHLQGRRMRQVRNHREAGINQNVISQKIELFITTAASTMNPTIYGVVIYIKNILYKCHCTNSWVLFMQSFKNQSLSYKTKVVLFPIRYLCSIFLLSFSFLFADPHTRARARTPTHTYTPSSP
jgi:hypothetical protein